MSVKPSNTWKAVMLDVPQLLQDDSPMMRRKGHCLLAADRLIQAVMGNGESISIAAMYFMSETIPDVPEKVFW